MVIKKKTAKNVKKAKKVDKKTEKKLKFEKTVKEEEEESEGTGLDDAFADDEDVTYAESKPRKVKKKDEEEEEEDDGMSEDEIETELDGIENQLNGHEGGGEVMVKASKPIKDIRKGDKIKVDGNTYEVDSHYVLMDHKSTKEMAIEMFDPKTDKDYQLRYFDDQAEATLEFYELQEIMYFKKPVVKIEW